MFATETHICSLQANAEDILDLRSFACATPSLSFALVTKYTRSKWSPPLQLCVQAGEKILIYLQCPLTLSKKTTITLVPPKEHFSQI